MAKTTKWICPTCKKPEVVAGYLGWRDCKGCGWEERQPTELAESSEPVSRTECIEICVEHFSARSARPSAKEISEYRSMIEKMTTPNLRNEAQAWYGEQDSESEIAS